MIVVQRNLHNHRMVMKCKKNYREWEYHPCCLNACKSEGKSIFFLSKGESVFFKGESVFFKKVEIFYRKWCNRICIFVKKYILWRNIRRIIQINVYFPRRQTFQMHTSTDWLACVPENANIKKVQMLDRI